MIMIEVTPGDAFASKAVKRFSLLAVSFGVAILISLASSASAAITQFWAGPGGTTNAPVNGTWTNGVGNGTLWSDGIIDTGNSTWTNGNSAFFGGADGSYAIKVGGAVTVANLRFLASGYTLTNNAVQTISGTGSSQTLIVDAGKTATVGTNVTFGFAGSGTVKINAGGAPSGTLIVENGGIVQQTVNGNLVIVGSNTLVSVKTGGIFRDAFSGAGSPHLVIGDTDGDDVTLSVDGGAVSIARTTAGFWVPGHPVGPVSTGNLKGTLTVNGGTLKNVTAGAASAIVLGTYPNYVGVFNLNGGTVTVQAVQSGGTNGVAGIGTSLLNFNGGTLKALANSLNFVDHLTAAYVRNGGVVIDNSGFALATSQALLHTTNALDSATDGGLTNFGVGTLTLTGANTYNGPTRVGAGKLVTTTASIGAGAYSVANGATLEVQVNSAGTSLTNSSLTLGTSAGTTLTFTLGGNASPNLPAIQDNGALTLGGTVTVNVTGTFDTSSSTNLLIRYSSGGAGTFVIGSVPAATGGATATLINAGNQLMLIYAQPAQAVKWAVGNGNWDVTTPNWQPVGGGSAINYVETSPVTFDDTAAGISPITVTLTGNRFPAGITNNSSKNYTITGGFSLLSGGSLDKSGSGTLTMMVNSTITGGAAIHSGTVQVGNGATAGSLGNGNIANDGALVFNRSDTLTVVGAISGSGTVANNGSGTVILAATNTYSGLTTVNSGKLSVLSTSSGNGNYTVADGATLEVQAVNSTSFLQIGGLSLGTSGHLTNNFNLGNARVTTFPLVYVVGDVNLNGNVVVNATGSGMTAGTYVLLQYTGTLTGTGNFVAGGFPGLWTLTNDTANKQLIITGTPGFVWDSGNTNNGSVIDAGSGTWDLTAGNNVWNNAGANVPFASGNNALFSGADGAYGIKVATAISAPNLQFLSSGYTLTNDSPQTISPNTVSTAVPKVMVAAGKTATIGTNVTISLANSSYLGNVGDTPGGTLIIENGGLISLTTANTLALDGAGSVLSIKAGGVLRHAGGNSPQIAIGASNTGNAPTLSVDGGLLDIIGNGKSINVGNGTGPAAGILTLNAGSVNMAAGTTRAVTLGVNAGNAGTLNLNGGVLNAAQINKGNPSAFATNNFNGGTIRAVNATFAATFLTGLDCANVRNGGLVFDDAGFALTIGQPLQHSTLPGDNAIDGGLTKLGAGSLTLTAANTYTGPTTVSNGTLLVNGSILANAAVTGGALGGTGTIGGNVNVAAGGTLAPGAGDTGALTITGNLNLQGNVAVVINESLSPSNNFCTVIGTLANSGTGTVTVTNLGPAPVLGDVFTLFNKPVVNGNALSVTPPPGTGLTWSNRLSIDGSIMVIPAPTIPSYPTNLMIAVSGSTVTLSWPATHLGWIAQSNSVSLVATNFWFDIVGSDSTTGLTNVISPGQTNVFYRLRHP